jgi:AGZA family xanthine/uracil permease-like MFS transporter
VLIQWNSLLGALHITPGTLPSAQQASYQALTLLANGFIVSAMLWSAVIIDVIDRRRGRALAICLLAGALTLFGVIHSPYADGRLFVPGAATPRSTWALAAGYVLLGAVTWAIDRLDRTPPASANP